MTGFDRTLQARTPAPERGRATGALLALIVGGLSSAAELAPSAQTVAPPTAGVSPARPVAANHILVKLADAAAEKRFLASTEAKTAGLLAGGRVSGSKWITVRIPAGADPRVIAQKAAAMPGVLRAAVDSVIRIADHPPPSDPMYLPPPVNYCDPLLELCVDQWGLFDADAESAWHVIQGSPEVVIAILDSGVDLDHDDLFGHIWTNPGEIPGNGIDDDGNGIIDDIHGADFAGDNVGAPDDDPASFDGSPDIPEGGEWVEDPDTIWGLRFDGDPAVGDGDDNNGDGLPDLGVFHGTAVAGVAAAMTDNLVPGSSTDYEGMAGACRNCRIMAVRMVNAEGEALLSDAVSAIYYAVDMNATIINASWGLDTTGLGPGSPEIAPLREAVDHAAANGVTFVAAAGNSGAPGVHYPAADPRVIAVGSSGLAGLVSYFSSTAFPGEVPDNGLDDDGNGWIDDVVDVVAPGEGIWSTWVFAAYDSLVFELLGDPNWPPGTDTYSFSDGTSLATPLVAGYLGLLKSRFPGASAGQLRAVLRANADPAIGLPGYDAESGFGRLQMLIPSTLPMDGNESPTAHIADAKNGVLTVYDRGTQGIESATIDGSASSDPDGSIVSYSWSWSRSDGAYGVASGPYATIPLAGGTSCEVTLIVTDDAGAPSLPAVVTVTLVSKAGVQQGGKGGVPRPWYRAYGRHTARFQLEFISSVRGTRRPLDPARPRPIAQRVPDDAQAVSN